MSKVDDALEHGRRGSYNEAELILLQCIVLEREPIRALIELGKLYSKLGRYEEAKQLLLRAARRAPRNTQPLRHLGALYQRLGDYDEATAAFRKAVEIDPGEPTWAHYGAGGSAPDFVISEELRLCYAPMPKCASSSVKAAILKLTKGIQTVNPHAFYQNPFFGTQKIDPSTFKDLYKFTIVRDPVDRLISYHRRNVIHDESLMKEVVSDSAFGLPTKPTFAEFVTRLDDYCLCFNDVRHHTLPQAAYLRDFFTEFDEVFLFEHMSEFYAQLASVLKVELPVYELMKSSEEEADPSALDVSVLDRLYAFYRADYELLADHYRVDAMKKIP
jgi:tetratricopeptide (TPR) repeat protein